MNFALISVICNQKYFFLNAAWQRCQSIHLNKYHQPKRHHSIIKYNITCIKKKNNSLRNNWSSNTLLFLYVIIGIHLKKKIKILIHLLFLIVIKLVVALSLLQPAEDLQICVGPPHSVGLFSLRLMLLLLCYYMGSFII